jgi:hypothetical protein
MKKSIALFLSLSYLIFSIGSLRAEASLLENKESQENIFSVKQSEESSINHFAESPSPKKSFNHFSDRVILSEIRIQATSFSLQVPLFLRNCNFRR